MKPTSDWRSLIKVHPAAEMFPLMEGDEFKSLVEDIRVNGLRRSISTWFDKDEQEWLLDGRNRLNALEELGYQFKIVKTGGYGPASDRPPHLKITKPGNKGTEYVIHLFAHGQQVTEPYSYVTSLNIERRHLTADQKRDLIAQLLKARPERSDRATAKIAKVSDKTVGAVREKLEAGAEIPHVEERVGGDGKTYHTPEPASQPLPTTLSKRDPYAPEQGWELETADQDVKDWIATFASWAPKKKNALTQSSFT